MLHTLPPNAQKAVQEVLDQEDREEAAAREPGDDTGRIPTYEPRDDDTQNLRLGKL